MDKDAHKAVAVGCRAGEVGLPEVVLVGSPEVARAGVPAGSHRASAALKLVKWPQLSEAGVGEAVEGMVVVGRGARPNPGSEADSPSFRHIKVELNGRVRVRCRVWD